MALMSNVNVVMANDCNPFLQNCGPFNGGDQKTDQGKDYDRNSSVNTDQVTQDSSANDDKDSQDQLVAKH